LHFVVVEPIWKQKKEGNEIEKESREQKAHEVDGKYYACHTRPRDKRGGSDHSERA